jgi:hypothetical protein
MSHTASTVVLRARALCRHYGTGQGQLGALAGRAGAG